MADERFSENLRLQGKLTRHQDIVQALEKNEIKKYVQPIFDAAQHRVIGFDALGTGGWANRGAVLKLLRSFGALAVYQHDIVIDICEAAITERIDMDQANSLYAQRISDVMLSGT